MGIEALSIDKVNRESAHRLLLKLYETKHLMKNHLRYWMKEGRSAAYSNDFIIGCDELKKHYEQAIMDLEKLSAFYEQYIYGSSIYD